MAPHGGTERRALTRRGGVRYEPVLLESGPGGAAPLAAEVRDLSVLGAGLVSADPLQPGTRLRVRPWHLETGLPAEVCHATQRPEGNWLIGCRFLRLPRTEEMLGFG